MTKTQKETQSLTEPLLPFVVYVGESTGSRGDRHTSHLMANGRLFFEPVLGILVMEGGLVKTLLPGFRRDKDSDP